MKLNSSRTKEDVLELVVSNTLNTVSFYRSSACLLIVRVLVVHKNIMLSSFILNFKIDGVPLQRNLKLISSNERK